MDVKTPEGKDIVLKLLSAADVFIENFRPGAMDNLGFSYSELQKTNPGLIYCSAKGFLNGPYQHRTALDEVAQMMGGLAYMTGPPGRPLRAGSSVIDIMGGMYGVIAILAALEERHRTNKGQKVTSALFENVVYLMGQHMAQTATTGSAPPPMSVRVSAWAVYDIFETKGDDQIFVGVVSDSQWKVFCESFELTDFISDKDMEVNSGRVEKRDVIIPILQNLFKTYTKVELMEKLEKTGQPFAPINTPEDLFNDPVGKQNFTWGSPKSKNVDYKVEHPVFSADKEGRAQISYIDQFPEPKNMEQGIFLQRLSDALEESKNKIIIKLPLRSAIVANNYFWLHGRKPFKENKDLVRELLRIRGSFIIN